MSFQKCPACDGSGNVYDYFSMGTSAVCPTCQGARIIDEVTGLPPEGQIPKTITTTGDSISNIINELT